MHPNNPISVLWGVARISTICRAFQKTLSPLHVYHLSLLLSEPAQGATMITNQFVLMCAKGCAFLLQLNTTNMRPPAIPSPEFDADYAFTLAFGAINSTNRTAYETDTAKFWYDESTGKALLDATLVTSSHAFTIVPAFLPFAPPLVWFVQVELEGCLLGPSGFHGVQSALKPFKQHCHTFTTASVEQHSGPAAGLI